MGLPLIATDVRGCRQVVDVGRNGLLVPPCDSRALSTAIERIASDPVQRVEMGAASRGIAAERFDERAVVCRVLETYRDVADRKGIELRLAGPVR